MRDESRRINDRLDAERCESRAARVEVIVNSFRLSLPHPHDFYPSSADVCWIPEVRKAIVDGTDEEFQECEANLRSRIPELSAAWLDERSKFFLQLLPQDPPSPKHLHLATTLFDCAKCCKFGLHIEDALSHRCYNYGHSYDYGREVKAGFANGASASAFYRRTDIPWDSGFSKYEFSAKLSAIVREIIVQCGEDPDRITTQEMNRKHHRFARFGCRDGMIAVVNWLEVVSSVTRLLDDPMPHVCHPVSLSTHATADPEMHRAGFYGLTNYRNMYPTRRTESLIGVACAVGGRRNPKATNGGTNISAPSKITLFVRKFLSTCKDTAYRASSNVRVFQASNYEPNRRRLLSRRPECCRGDRIQARKQRLRVLTVPVTVL